MAKAKIEIVYDKQTGQYRIISDLEQVQLNLGRHNREHEQLTREFSGPDAEIKRDSEQREVPPSSREVETAPEKNKVSQ